MSPEQAEGVTDVRSDIYSVGAVGYFLLTGQTPFRDRRVQEYLNSLASKSTASTELRPEIPSDLEAVIARCLRSNPEERYASIAQLDQALAACDCANDWSAADAAQWWQSSAGVVGSKSESAHA
jgi:serine/threonine-protein kinase